MLHHLRWNYTIYLDGRFSLVRRQEYARRRVQHLRQATPEGWRLPPERSVLDYEPSALEEVGSGAVVPKHPDRLGGRDNLVSGQRLASVIFTVYHFILARSSETSERDD